MPTPPPTPQNAKSPITSEPEVTPEHEPISEEPTSEEPPAAEQAVDGPTPQTPAPKKQPERAYYSNCTEAREAGVAPLHVGDPGYRPALDRDKYGVACE